jgi:hypothetical protein
MFALAAAAGAVIALRPAKPRTPLLLWSFSDHHNRMLTAVAQRPPAPLSELTLENIGGRAMGIRLQSILMSGRTDAGVPDLVHLEASHTNCLLRPPVDGAGLLPLDPWLDERGERTIADPAAPGHASWVARAVSDGGVYRHDGTAWQPAAGARTDRWRQRLVAARVAMWSKEGRSFGIPFDVHPSTLVWREDLWRAVGIDLGAITTWDEFQDAAVRFERAWAERGARDPRQPVRRAFELRTINADLIATLLAQRRVNLVDDTGIHFTEPVVVDTLARYATWVAGPRAFGRDAAGATNQMTGEVIRGEICAFLAPDWRIGLIQKNDRDRLLAGTLRMRPLPVWRPGDLRTTTFGGSMVGIMRTTPQPEAAWQAIERLLLSAESFAVRTDPAVGMGHILPPLPERWDDPIYDRADPYFGGQQTMRMYIDLAAETPPRRFSPATGLADAALADALAVAKAHVRAHGTVGLEDACRAALAAGAADLRRRMEHSLFDPVGPAGGP